MIPMTFLRLDIKPRESESRGGFLVTKADGKTRAEVGVWDLFEILREVRNAYDLKVAMQTM